MTSLRRLFLQGASLRPQQPQNAVTLSDKLNKFYNRQQSSRSREGIKCSQVKERRTQKYHSEFC